MSQAAIGRIASRQLGLVTRGQLLALGLSSQTICYRISAGLLRVVHPGVYLVPGAPASSEQRLMAAWLAAGNDTAVSHNAAALVWGLEGVKAAEPHILVAHPRRLRLVGVVVHRTRTLSPGDVVRRGALVVTSPARTLIDLAGVLDPDPLEDAVDDALRRGLVRVPALKRRLDQLGDRGVAGSGALRRLVAERTAVREPGSGLESRFRRRLQKAGLPLPVPQLEIRDGHGRFVARVDFAYPQARLAIEIDGYGSHSGRKRWESDLSRQNRLMVAGWRFLRFSTRDIDADAGSLFATIKTALARSGESNTNASGAGFPRSDQARRRARRNSARS